MIDRFIWVLWDLLAAAIVLWNVRRGVIKGFVSMLIGLLIYVAATFAATKLNRQLADLLYQNVVYDIVMRLLTKNLNQFLSQAGGAPLDILSALPFNLDTLVGHKKEELAALPLSAADGLAATIMDMALKTPIMSLLYGVSFLAVFTLTAWLMRWLSRFFTGINKIPVLGSVNAVFGGIVGDRKSVV